MLKALLLSLITLAFASMATAQTNLVPNASFEDTVNCEITTQSTIYKATHWYNPNNATPDVWDCDLDRICGMAMSPAGGNPSYQPSYDGDRHAGIYCWDGPGSSNTRDYLGVRIVEPMVAGTSYEVSLWYARRRNFRFAIDHIGIWFGADSLWQNTTWWLNVAPQLRLQDPSAPYLEEGQIWTQLRDTIVADGGEHWMVIGNFDPAAFVNGTAVEPNAPNPYAYYFIDQVEVREVVGTGLSGAMLQTWWAVDGLAVRWPASFVPEQINVYDALGRPVHQVRSLATGVAVQRIDLGGLAAGVYIVDVVGQGKRLSQKVVKEEGGF